VISEHKNVLPNLLQVILGTISGDAVETRHCRRTTIA
jgi:hypothetical protein